LHRPLIHRKKCSLDLPALLIGMWLLVFVHALLGRRTVVS
jgi:hypothetical protein